MTEPTKSEKLEAIKTFEQLIGKSQPSASQVAYEAGKDCALNGADTDNCHFRHFATPALTKDWERGKDYGERLKKK